MSNTQLIPEGIEGYLSGSLLTQDVGAPFFIGLAVGYFAKKVFRIALFVSGAFLVLYFVLEYFGLFTLSNETLEGAANTVSQDAQSAGSFLMNRLTGFTSKGVSAAAGFLVGLKVG